MIASLYCLKLSLSCRIYFKELKNSNIKNDLDFLMIVICHLTGIFFCKRPITNWEQCVLILLSLKSSVHFVDLDLGGSILNFLYSSDFSTKSSSGSFIVGTKAAAAPSSTETSVDASSDAKWRIYATSDALCGSSEFRQFFMIFFNFTFSFIQKRIKYRQWQNFYSHNELAVFNIFILYCQRLLWRPHFKISRGVRISFYSAF